MTAAAPGQAASHDAVTVRIHVPAPALQPYVTFYHFAEVAGPLEDFLYPEWANVRFALAGQWDVRMPRRAAPTPQQGALFGPTDRHGKVVTDGGRTFGFGLTPLGWHRLIGEPAWLMANRVRPLGRTLGVDGDALQDRFVALADEAPIVAAVERLLLDRLAETPPIDPLVLAVDRALRERPATAAAFAARVGVSGPRLRRLCLNTFGFPSKRLLRMQRFLGVLGQIRTAVGGAVIPAIEQEHYFDQAHFHRDFRDFMAMSARTYARAPRRLMNEAAAAQVRAGVTLSFALPAPPAEGQ